MLNASCTEARGSRRESSLVVANMANLLSGLRIFLAVAWYGVFAFAGQRPMTLGAIAVVAAGTDYVDGRIARRLGVASGAGRWLDNIADITFVLGALGCEAGAGQIPIYIPALIAISFAQYAIDSSIVSGFGAAPIHSRLGHWGGILNYALAIALSIAPSPAAPGAVIGVAAPLIAVFYIVAIGERVASYRAIRGSQNQI